MVDYRDDYLSTRYQLDRDSSSLGPILGIVAILAVIGVMFWIAATSDPAPTSAPAGLTTDNSAIAPPNAHSTGRNSPQGNIGTAIRGE